MLANMSIASAAVEAAQKKGSGTLFIVIIGALFLLFYFVMIRPQRNRQRQAAQMQNTVMPGQRVRTTSGMYGTIVSADDDDVVLEVAPGVQIRMMRRAIMTVLPDDDGQPPGEPHYGDAQTDHWDGQADGEGSAGDAQRKPGDEHRPE